MQPALCFALASGFDCGGVVSAQCVVVASILSTGIAPLNP